MALDALMADGRPAPFARFSELRRPDGDAIADMSLENYVEMRDAVIDPRHQLLRALELQLERRFPGHFIPRYAMVMFHAQIPYSGSARASSRASSRNLLTGALPPTLNWHARW